jgi:UDPglucose 6-dehydrogenase
VRGVQVVAYDPSGSPDSLAALGENLRFAPSATACIEQAEIVVIATPWREFEEIPAMQWARKSSPRTIIDCWRTLKNVADIEGIRYVTLGTGVVEAPVAKLTGSPTS